MSNKLSFTVVTPEKVVYEAEIDSATIPTKDGEITVLANHMPLVSLLSSGEMVVRKNKDEKFYFAIARGVIEVRPGSKLIVMTDFAERASEIDLEEAVRAKARAEEILADEHTLSEEDFTHFEAILEREITKIKVKSRLN